MIDAQSLAVRTVVLVLAVVALITLYLRRAAGAPADALRSASGPLAGDGSEIPVKLEVENKRGAVAQSKAIWHKSTYSGLNGCVEIAVLDGQIGVRDSKDRNGPILRFTHTEWDSFLNGVKDGQFD
jgi:Domain of unknown function (DUF397)